ncbi:MAG: ZIP family metal transporter, partial [Candidatus Izemoplasmatales bacterium]|nr:ZIP family metal transporter [Candidatus Izemoplasmatales bacterium]
PLKQENMSNGKAFLYGSLSGIVEPVFAAVGLVLASQLTMIMPWFLALAAGAMIYVVVEELIPEAHLGEHSNIGTIAVMIGFVVMMILDVALG